MAEIKQRMLLSWDLVFKLSTLVILVFSGLSLEQVDSVSRHMSRQTDQVSKAVTEVQQQTHAVEGRVEKMHELVTENRELLHDHAGLTVEHQVMFTHLQPLFADIVQRQTLIREDLAQLTTLAKNFHEHEDTFTRLLTERTQLLHDITAQLQALVQAMQASPQPRKEPE